mmetsp:Transcript_30503/g.75821  ORF Transcript_30503/g.75821 Transcript_30503/m.75821 type:complete len:81 (-) Transcript_30503:267-509(-)
MGHNTPHGTIPFSVSLSLLPLPPPHRFSSISTAQQLLVILERVESFDSNSLVLVALVVLVVVVVVVVLLLLQLLMPLLLL